MKKLLLSAFVICLAGTSIAQESPLWMRHCALSPDGTTIAFTYKGDIYTVPSTGGRATQITTNPALIRNRYGVPTVNKLPLHRIAWEVSTFSSYPVKEEHPSDWPLIQAVRNLLLQRQQTHLFTANIAPSAEDAGFPSGQFQQVYEVAVTGGRPAMFSSMPMECISINKEGVMLYQDKKDTKTIGASIRYPLLPVTSGHTLPGKNLFIKNKLLRRWRPRTGMESWW